MFRVVKFSLLKSEDSDILSVVNVALLEEWIGVILDPHTSQAIAGDFAVLEVTRGIVGDVDANVLAVSNRAVSNLNNISCTIVTFTNNVILVEKILKFKDNSG